MELHPSEIQNHLNTQLIGKNVIWEYEVDSTNDIAVTLAFQGAPEGTVVLAESQRRGKGRMGRSWYSPPGEGIYLSVLLKPLFSPSRVYQMTFMAAVAVAETIRNSLNLNLQVKWPNDLILRNKKVGGILTELKASSDQIYCVVLGIGVNANITQFPEELRGRVTSLALESEYPIQRTPLIQGFLRALEKWYFLILKENSDQARSTDQPSLLFRTWRSLSCTLGNQVEIKTGSRIIRGLAIRVGLDGSLYVREDSGEEKQIITGDVALIT
jgi:BirA family biotin operon repressor/biotin-[acetyl-CoA-carboxylase] ligase